jgi:hypothetical protein
MATKKTAAKKSATKSGRNKSNTSNAENYTKPDLRDKIKNQVMADDKGGRAGQWSARKAQLVAHEYEAQGGGYRHPRNPAQKSLKHWGDERWHTADGKQAVQGDKTSRYLPDAAWKELTPRERKATDRKKVAGSRRGKQFVANTPAAAKARKRATRHEG